MTDLYSYSEGESDTDVESKSEEDKLDNTDDSTSADDWEDAVSSTSAYLDILKEQKDLGNKRLLKVFKANDTKNLQFFAEVRKRKDQRTMPRKWDQN